MRCNRKFFISAILAGLGLVSASAGANATCQPLAGTWYFYNMQGESPNIQTKFTSVVVGPALTNKATLETFSFTKTNKGFNNYTTSVIKCTMTVQANGNFTAPCVSYAVDGTHTANTSGKLTLTAACDFGGTINVQGDPTPVVIQGGHVNGGVGSGIATQGKLFHHFTVVKK